MFKRRAAIFSREDIEKAISACDLADYISDQYSISLRAGLVDRVGECPICHHEDSFRVHKIHQVYHCFDCGSSGNLISLIMLLEQKEFPEVIKELLVLADKK